MTIFFCTIPLLANLLPACQPPLPLAVGFVEGEHVLVAPVEITRIDSLAVRRGETVLAGSLLAEMDRRDAEIAVAQARAGLSQARSQLADLRQGSRSEEIAGLEAQAEAARARLSETERAVVRATDLAKRGIASKSQLDNALTERDVAAADMARAEAGLAASRLPARSDRIAAAEAAVDQARAALESAEWRLDQRQLVAPSAGRVTDIIRNPGEIAGPQAPVLTFLPEGAVKLRLYVPEAALSRIAPGTRLSIACDGCGEGMGGTVTYVSPDPEYTPPVIYSRESRQKLVWLVEARPDEGAKALTPGQIVDADLAEAEGGS